MNVASILVVFDGSTRSCPERDAPSTIPHFGSKDRLDFTVVGPAVNEVSRILAMSRAVERDVLLSASFAAALGASLRSLLVSVGRYALRGVAQPQELFIPEPGFDPFQLLR